MIVVICPGYYSETGLTHELFALILVVTLQVAKQSKFATHATFQRCPANLQPASDLHVVGNTWHFCISQKLKLMRFPEKTHTLFVVKVA